MMKTLILCHKKDESAVNALRSDLHQLTQDQLIVVNVIFSDQSMIAMPEDVLISVAEVDVILVIVSPSLLGNEEMMESIDQTQERATSGDVRLIPFLYRPVSLEGSFLGDFAPLPRNGSFVMGTNHTCRDAIWWHIYVEMKNLAETLYM